MKQPFSEVSRNTINKKLALQNRDFFLSLFTKLLSLWLHFSSYFSASFQDFSSETSNLTWNNFWSNSSSNIQVIIIFAHHMKKKRRKNIVSQSWIIFIWISPLFLQKRRKPTKYLENTTIIIIPRKPRNSEFFKFPTFQYQKSTLPITHWGKLAIFAKNYKQRKYWKNENFGDKNWIFASVCIYQNTYQKLQHFYTLSFYLNVFQLLVFVNTTIPMNEEKKGRFLLLLLFWEDNNEKKNKPLFDEEKMCVLCILHIWKNVCICAV